MAPKKGGNWHRWHSWGIEQVGNCTGLDGVLLFLNAPYGSSSCPRDMHPSCWLPRFPLASSGLIWPRLIAVAEALSCDLNKFRPEQVCGSGFESGVAKLDGCDLKLARPVRSRKFQAAAIEFRDSGLKSGVANLVKSKLALGEGKGELCFFIEISFRTEMGSSCSTYQEQNCIPDLFRIVA